MNNSTRYQVSSDDLSPKYKRPEFKYSDLGRVYDQSEMDISRNACGLYSSMTSIANNHNIEFTFTERQEIVHGAINEGLLNPKWGMYMSDACSYVAEWCRKNKGIDIYPKRVNWKEYRKLTGLGWNVSTGYRIKEGLWKDRMNHFLGDEDIKYGGDLGGHLVSFCNIKHLYLLSRLIYIDSYGSNYRYKETRINPKGLKKLISEGVVFENGYIFELK